ncbi:hypothetical protein M3J09_011787 [Ascochyta lentis]
MPPMIHLHHQVVRPIPCYAALARIGSLITSRKSTSKATGEQRVNHLNTAFTLSKSAKTSASKSNRNETSVWLATRSWKMSMTTGKDDSAADNGSLHSLTHGTTVCETGQEKVCRSEAVVTIWQHLW